uniref:Serpin peptidase inhibitor, clade E (nexin, plasminogen activator inhibitor type 1), member 3 n=1 Tax=Paramormyrops kingsleyae TaxID=1676925 RepID=A0A3B3QAY1_9TELE
MGGQWLSWLLVCLCLVRGRCGGLRDLHTEFAVRLYQAHADRGSNLIVSPLSVSMALGLLQFGEALGYNVKGKTYQHCPWKSGPIIQIRLACALFIQHDISLLPAFTQHASAWGNSSLVQTSFNQPNQTISQLEDWIRRNADGEVTWAGPHMALVSTLAFRSIWQRCFHLGEELPFTLTNGSVTKVPMMHQLTEAHFGKQMHRNVLELPYLGGYFGLLVVQPSDRKMPLSQLETQLSGHAVTMWHSSLHRIKMDIFLPRFRIHSKSSLRSVLPSLGVSDIFDPAVADFTGISAEEGLYVSEALQEAVVEVMENGTKAEAVTGTVGEQEESAVALTPSHRYLCGGSAVAYHSTHALLGLRSYETAHFLSFTCARVPTHLDATDSICASVQCHTGQSLGFFIYTWREGLTWGVV